MKGQHAAPRQGTGPAGIVLAALAVPLAVALTLALGVLSGVFLVLLGAVAIIVRVPGRAWLWTGLMMSWPAALAGKDAGVLDGNEPYVAGAAGVCVFTAWLLARRSIEKQRLQREWRETGGRMGTGPKVTVVAGWRVTRIAMTNTRRLDGHDEEIGALKAWREKQEAWSQEVEEARQVNIPALEAVTEVIRAAHEQEGLALPGALQAAAKTMPDPLRLVWDAERMKGA